MTKYKLLAGITSDDGKGGGAGWYEVPGEWEGTTPRAAIRSYLNQAEEGALISEFVAVPARSFQPVKVQVETALKFS